MKGFLSKHWFPLATVVLVLLIAAGLFFTMNKGSKLDLPVLKAATSFELEHIDGNLIDLHDHDGKVRIVYFFWSSCPDVCGPTNHDLSKVQEVLTDKGVFGEDAVMFSISFDPERDTKETLAAYSKSLNVDSKGWFFLRGDEMQTKQLAEKYGVSVIKNDKGDFAHTNIVTLVDRNGHIRKYYNASQANLDYKEVAEAVIQLSQEQQ